MSAPGRDERAALTRDTVVSSAIAFADQYGLQTLSMRQLGRLLGVEAMSLYNHVNGREDLLEAMVAHVVDEVRIPPLEQVGPVDGWQGFLQHVAHAIRGIAVDHPKLFPLIATRPPAAPWLRPPLRSLPLVEDFLDGLEHRGLTEDSAVYVYKAFTGFLLGHLLLEVAQAGVPTAPPEEPLDEGGADVPNTDQQLSLDDFPTLRRLGTRLRHHDAQAEFEVALESLLMRLDRELSM
jgi:TetR/AcrR family transcriptional regulator, tetracycline repressor protein